MGNNPLVSVILPTYNGKSEWLSESINSVLNQTFKDFELIIINDASTNGIEDTILKYKKKDSRIVYLKNEKNLKLTKTLNKGIENSKGKYIARIDDDDIWNDKEKLQKQVDFMEKNRDYGLCGSSLVVETNEKGEKIGEWDVKCSDKEIRDFMLYSCQFLHSSVVIRKSVLDDVGLYDYRFNMSEDYELWCRIGTKSKLMNLCDVLVTYRINTKGITQKNRSYQRFLALKICVKYRNYYPNFFRSLYHRLVDFLLPKEVIFLLSRIKQRLLSYLK